MTSILFITERSDFFKKEIDALSQEYDIVLAGPHQSHKLRPDLAIVDAAALEDILKVIKRMKGEQGSVFLPTIVISRRGYDSMEAHAAKLVDSVIDRDHGTAALINRVKDLLKIRELSKQASDELSSIFDSMDAGICVVNGEHEIVRANRPLARILGMDQGEITGRMCETLFHTTECREMECPLYRTLYGTPRSESEMIIRAKNNRKIQSLITSSMLLNTEGNIVGAVVTVKDLSDREQEENERIELQKYLSSEQKKDAISKLSGSLAHYLNNLMAVILSNAYFSQNELDENHPVQSDLAAISEAAKRGVAVLDQLVSVSRRQILRPQVVNLNDLIMKIKAELEGSIDSQLKLSLDLSDNLYNIEVDLERLEKTILDLVVGSSEMMTEKGEILLKTYNSYFVQRGLPNPGGSGAGVVIEISNTGPGLEPFEIDRLFDPLFSSKHKNRTGLEYAVAQGMIEQLDGHVEVDSAADEGTTFRVWLPALKSSGSTTRRSKSTGIPGPGQGFRVLLVDDEDMVRKAAKRMLQDHGYMVMDSGSAKDAVEIFKSQSSEIDVLLTDVVMPEMNGRELAETLRKIRRDLKVVYISGYGDDIISHKGILPKDVILVRKPFSANQLFVSIWDALHLDLD